MPPLEQLETNLRGLVFDREPAPVPGLDERGRRAYRRQVRRSLMSGVRLAIPIARRVLGEDAVNDWIERWLAERPPTTRAYWRLPLQFAEWLSARDDTPHPAFGELVHWESLEVDVLNAPDDASEHPAPDPTEDRRLVLHPSARLGIYNHPVHKMTLDDAIWPERAPAPIFVLAWRKDDGLRWMETHPQTAQLLARAEGGGTLGAGFAFLDTLYGTVDRAGAFRGAGAPSRSRRDFRLFAALTRFFPQDFSFSFRSHDRRRLYTFRGPCLE
ncbi:MAG: hypothetical protein M5R36_08885 [Deltaproteobacteria bacterium]|nr:hypothetical protein [Deltaproteobacteria bacterium]